MKIAQKLGLAAVVGILGVSVIGMSAPAQAANDSSWGCGGWCKTGKP